MTTKTTNAGPSAAARWGLVLTLTVLAFFATYRYATARTGASNAVAGTSIAGAGAAIPLATGTGAPAGTGEAASAGCSCCGGGAPAGAETTKAAKVTGDVQKISIDTSKGYYDPTVIELKAGVAAELTFSQSSGCLASVQSADLGFNEDLTAGPKTIKLPALKAGTYEFSCGMQMVFGSIVVK